MDHSSAHERLGNRPSRKLANNTYLQRRNNVDIAVKLHDTDVITFKLTGETVLNSGGWKTATTKSRIDCYIPDPWSLLQIKGLWYVVNAKGNGHARAVPKSEWIPFADGMVLHKDGETASNAGTDPNKTLDFNKAVKKYAKQFIADLRAGKVKKPGTEDCFYCSMSEIKTGKSIGEVSHNGNHIRSHIEENYQVPSLLYRALEWNSSQVMKWAVGAMWNGEDENKVFGADFVWQQIEKTLCRFILQQCGEVY